MGLTAGLQSGGRSRRFPIPGPCPFDSIHYFVYWQRKPVNDASESTLGRWYEQGGTGSRETEEPPQTYLIGVVMRIFTIGAHALY